MPTKLRAVLVFTVLLLGLFRPNLQPIQAGDPVVPPLKVTSLADSGPGTLRARLSEAAAGITTTIDIAIEGTIFLTSGPLEVNLPSRKLLIQRDTALAPDAEVTISSDGAFRTFVVTENTSLTLRSLIVTNGPTRGGGAIENFGTLRLERVNLQYAVSYGQGGGLLNHLTGTATIVQSAILTNTSLGDGAGIFNDGTLNMGNTTLAGNWTPTLGGGVFNSSTGRLKIINSSFNNNRANMEGGAIYNGNAVGVATVSNSILANSYDSTNCKNVAAINSLQFPGLSCGNDVTSIEPGFDQLMWEASYGAVLTLKPDSPAIDSGSKDSIVGCATADLVNNRDARNRERPVDGTGDGVKLCDIGAYEAPNLPRISAQFFPQSVVPTPSTTGVSTRLEFALYNPTGGLTNVTFDTPLPPSFRVARYQPTPRTQNCDSVDNGDIVTNEGATSIHVGGIDVGANKTCLISVNVVGSEVGVYAYPMPSIMSDQGVRILPGDAAIARVGIYTCDQAGLSLAVTNGGSAQFDCVQPTALKADNGDVILANPIVDGQGGMKIGPGRGGVFFRAEGPQVIQGLTVERPHQIYVHSRSSLTIRDSNFSGGRSATDGGLIVVRSGGQLFIYGSTFFDNKAERYGGVIYVESGGRVTIANSTFTMNEAKQGGGVIYAQAGSTVSITNSTFSGNGPTGVSGSAIMVAGAADIQVSGTILDDTCAGTITSNGNNLQTKGSSCGAGITFGVAALDSALKDNGGSTLTLSLGNNSAATGMIANCAAFPLDQRGFVRPTSGCDIGAFEAGGTRPGYRLSVVGNPPYVRAGDPFTLRLEAIKGNGSIVTSYTGTAHLSSTIDAVKTLPTINFPEGGGGTRDVPTTLLITGNHQITAVDTSESEIFATVPVEVRAYPKVIMKFGPAKVTGGITKITYIISNPNSHITLHNIRLVHAFPLNNLVAMLYIPAEWNVHQTCDAQPYVFATGQRHEIYDFDLAPGQECQYEINVKANAVGDINTALTSVSSDETGTRDFPPGVEDTLHVEFVKPLVRTDFAPYDVLLNGTSTLTIEVYNPNGGDVKISSLTTTLAQGITTAAEPRKKSSCPTVPASAITTSAGSIGLSANTTIPAYTSCLFSIDVQDSTAGLNTLTTTSSFAETGANPDATGELKTSTTTCDSSATGIQNITWQGNGITYSRNPFTGAITSDGRYATFVSEANSFVTHDVAFIDAFVYDILTCRYQRVSMKQNGVQAIGSEAGSPNDSSVIGASNGNVYVAFTSTASNLTSGILPFSRNVFLSSFTTDPVLVTPFKPFKTNDPLNGFAMSGDGRYTAFSTLESSFVAGDTNNKLDVLIFDRDHPTASPVRVMLPGNVQPGEDVRVPSLSGNGRFVAVQFCYKGCVAIYDRDSGNDGVFDQADTAMISIAHNASGQFPADFSTSPSISPNGNYVVYWSRSNAIAPNASCLVGTGCGYLYLYNRLTDQNTFIAGVRTGQLLDPYDHVYGIGADPSVSDDGRFVVFTSNLRHDPIEDLDSSEDIYVYDTQRFEFKLISKGQNELATDKYQSYGPSLSGDGRMILFGSDSPKLVSYDTNNLRDAFVAPNPLYGLPVASSVSGQFRTIIGETNPQFNLPARELYALDQPDGTQIEVQLPASVDPSAFEGQQVTIMGYPDETQPGENVVVVPDSSAITIHPPSTLPMAAIPNHNWATLMCRFSDSSGSPPQTLTWATDLMTGSQMGGVRNYWLEQSYNTVQMPSNAAYGWFTLPKPRSDYLGLDGLLDVNELALLFNDCVGASSGVTFTNFGGINIFLDKELDGYAWGSTDPLTLGAKTYYVTWLPPWAYQNQAPLVHEMGHSFGLHHTSGEYLSSYDSDWDVMSGPWNNCPPFDAVYGCLGVGLNAYHRLKLGWIPNTRKAEILPGPATQTVTLERLSQPVDPNSYLIATIPIRGSATQFYTVEARFRVGYDAALPAEGVIIHRVDTLALDRDAQVVDADLVNGSISPDGDPNNGGAVWMYNETFRDVSNGITVKVVGQGPRSFTVEITNSLTPPPVFGAPALLSPADPGHAAPFQMVTFTWKLVGGATSYELQLGETNSASVTSYPTTNATPSLTIMMPVSPGAYYWKVRAINASATNNSVIRRSEWSASRPLILESVAAAGPQLNYASATTRALTWNRISWATGYSIEVDNNANFTSPEFKNYALDADRLIIITGELQPGLYYWRVRARKPDGVTWGLWSAAETFILSKP